MFSRLTINQLHTLALYRWSAMRSTSLSFLATDRQGLFVMDGFLTLCYLLIGQAKRC
jgi:hypothetical protein